VTGVRQVLGAIDSKEFEDFHVGEGKEKGRGVENWSQ